MRECGGNSGMATYAVTISRRYRINAPHQQRDVARVGARGICSLACASGIAHNALAYASLFALPVTAALHIISISTTRSRAGAARAHNATYRHNLNALSNIFISIATRYRA